MAATVALTAGCGIDDDLEPYPRTKLSNDSGSRIAINSHAALQALYCQYPEICALGQRAKAVLVFPDVSRAGVVIGGHGGNGAMFFQDDRIHGYYQTVGGSIGAQVGAARYGYAIFFMTNKSLLTLERSDGWEVALSPSFVIGNCGELGAISTTTIDKNFYVVFFNPDGLMAAINLEAAKITRIKPLP